MGLTGLEAALVPTQILVPRWWWIREKFYQRSQEGSSVLGLNPDGAGMWWAQGTWCLLLSVSVIPDNHLNVQIQGKWSSMNHLHWPSPTPVLQFKRNHTLKDSLRASEKSFMFMPWNRVKKSRWKPFIQTLCVCALQIHTYENKQSQSFLSWTRMNGIIKFFKIKCIGFKGPRTLCFWLALWV